MNEAAWKTRLRSSVKDSGLSMRSLSISAGFGEGYMHDVLKPNESKIPSFEKLVKIVNELPVSLSYIVYGYDIGPDEEKLLAFFAELSDDQKDIFLRLANSFSRKSPEK